MGTMVKARAYLLENYNEGYSIVDYIIAYSLVQNNYFLHQISLHVAIPVVLSSYES